MNQYTFGQKFFSLLFYLRLIVVSFLYCLSFGLFFLLILPFQSKKRRQNTWRWAIKFYGKTVLLLSGYPFVRIRYRDLAPEETAPGVYILNHRSGSDAFMVAFLPGGVIQVVNDWPFKLFFYGFFAKLGGYYNIKGTPWDEFLKQAGDDIRKFKFSVVGFPEGTRSGCSQMGKFHGALFRLALEIKCPVYPVVLTGNDKIPDLNFVMHAGTVNIYKLPAIQPEVFENWSGFKLKNYVRNLMADKISELEGDNE